MLKSIESYIIKPAIYISAAGGAVTLWHYNQNILGGILLATILASLFYFLYKDRRIKQ